MMKSHKASRSAVIAFEILLGSGQEVAARVRALVVLVAGRVTVELRLGRGVCAGLGQPSLA